MPFFSDDGLVAVGESRDKFVRMRGFAGGDDFFFGCILAPIADVVTDRPAEQNRILGNQRDLPVGLSSRTSLTS